jgi:hypothetical protein
LEKTMKSSFCFITATRSFSSMILMSWFANFHVREIVKKWHDYEWPWRI